MVEPIASGRPPRCRRHRPVADHDGAGVARAVRLDEAAPAAHRHAEDVEVVPRHARAVDALRLAVPVRLAVDGVNAAAS
jgi:hypothetical protein